MAALTKAGQFAPKARITSRASSVATSLRSAPRPTVAMKLQTTGRIAFRRAYADKASKPRPSKLRRTLRWAWRLSYLSVGGLVGYTLFVIYQDRHPEPQYDPDPSKKTLVILGIPPPPREIELGD